jgi:excisionase family DNA binding protein
MIRATALPDVLTLEETASYLRMPTETIERVATRGQLPGRRIEDSWRFLREAIDEWLRSSDSRTVLLQQAGALSDDDMTADLLSSVYQLRGRPEKGTDA